MYFLVLVTATLFLRDVCCDPSIQKIKEYYNHASLNMSKKAWSVHRAPMEHAIKTAISETAGLPGMNIYVMKQPEKLALAYLHDDNHVKVIFSDLYFKRMPRCRLPDLQFPLSSNVIKIETELSKIIIHANYTLLRDKKQIIEEAPKQDPLQNSPFLFSQVEDDGKIAIRADGCILKGFIIATLGASSVNLGYDYFNLTKCVYTIEIYNTEQRALPVITKYNLDKKDASELGLAELMLRPLLSEELLPKIQGAIFSFINTSAIFGNKLPEYKQNQEKVFKHTKDYMIQLFKKLKKNHAFKKDDEKNYKLNDLNLKWSDGSDLSLTSMKLFGLDTMYLPHSGGPVMMSDVMIAEEIRFSSLQVHGTLYAVSSGEDTTLSFAAQITDLVVDIHMDEKHRDKGFKLLSVKELGHMVVIVSAITEGKEESLIAGHLLNEVPKLIHKRLTEILTKLHD